jgi:hypothetical protein
MNVYPNCGKPAKSSSNLLAAATPGSPPAFLWRKKPRRRRSPKLLQPSRWPIVGGKNSPRFAVLLIWYSIGVLVLGVFFFWLIFPLLLPFAFYVYNIHDAYHLCVEYNQHNAQTGTPPW